MARAQSCYTGSEVQGMDVSKYQGTIDWDRVAEAGEVSFVYIRIADGMNLDRDFERNWREAGRVGLMRGFYHFFRGGLDGKAQAKLAADAVKRAGGMRRTDLPPALDFECPTFNSGPLSETRHCRGNPIAPDRVIKETKAYLTAIKSRLFRTPIVYTGGAWVTWSGRYPDYAGALSSYQLWRPQYNTTGCVNVPPGFSDPIMQQYTSSGRVQGIVGNVDLNAFRGNFQQLVRFAKARSYPWWLWTLGALGLGAVGAGAWYYSGRRLPWT